MKPLRLGIIGLGGMGQFHAANLLEGKVGGCELVAGCDANPKVFAKFPGLRSFATLEALLQARCVDAVLIATPHFAHTTVGMAALEAGLHVLVEKPISVQVADGRRLVAAHATRPGQVFAVMFNQRTDPRFQALRGLIQSGEAGAVRRVQWTVTDWFRSAAYYGNDGWRATWGGEGGGVLLNQCPHNLDMLQWLFGLPRQVTGFCGFGRYHDIEVEDDVTAYLEYPDGMHATFITSTGEAPGTNRLEVVTERGRLVCENDELVWLKNGVAMSEFSRTTSERFAKPPVESVRIGAAGQGGQHVEILQNFVDAVVKGTPLIARGEEGLASVELANAILLSAWTGRRVELPLDAEAYARELSARIRTSRFQAK